MKCIGYKDDQIEFDFQIFEIHLSIIITRAVQLSR